MQNEIDRIQKRLLASTPGPWRIGDWYGNNYILAPKGKVMLLAENPDATSANLSLMVHAPEDIRYLLGEVKRLQDELDRLKATI